MDLPGHGSHNHRLQVESGVLAEEARALLRGFFGRGVHGDEAGTKKPRKSGALSGVESCRFTLTGAQYRWLS